jgi:probable non-F420 flavinoid oxidoreductase
VTLLGFHASHELYSPRDLLRHVQLAERAGFQAAMCSDHFHPWTPAQGHSGYSFAWLAAALQATALPMGTICCPFLRYHPAIVAQAAATLAQMFPGRFWLALGSGEALNEVITGQQWPDKDELQSRLEESAKVIRALWVGETVNHHGNVTVQEAKLYTRSDSPPLLFGAATSPQTAEWVATWADGLLTVNMDQQTMRDIVDAFRTGGGEGKPIYLQVMMGYDTDEQRAWNDACRRWPISALDQGDLQNIATPEEFARRTAHVRPDDLKEKLRVSSDLRQHVEWLRTDLELGVDAILFYTISGTQEQFIDAYAEHVLPAIRAHSA